MVQVALQIIAMTTKIQVGKMTIAAMLLKGPMWRMVIRHQADRKREATPDHLISAVHAHRRLGAELHHYYYYPVNKLSP